VEEREAVHWVPLELTDQESVRACVDVRYDAIVHLAALSSGSDAMRDPGYAWAVNAGGTARIVHVLVEAKRTEGADPLLLVASTGEVYGRGDPRPRRETDPVAPCSPYAATKAGAELAALEAWRRVGVRVRPHWAGPGRALRRAGVCPAPQVRQACRRPRRQCGEPRAGARVSPRPGRGGRVRAVAGPGAAWRDLQCRVRPGAVAGGAVLSAHGARRRAADPGGRPRPRARRGHPPSRRGRLQAPGRHRLGAAPLARRHSAGRSRCPDGLTSTACCCLARARS
ncbi:MAG: hypothetical protein DMD36_06305, partial [Gemmatimonadetes bacterium]